MTDDKLRDLERRWRQTGAVAEETAYAAHRLRLGLPPLRHAQLAAALGHVEGEVGRLYDPSLNLDGLAAILLDCGQGACVRACLAVGVRAEGRTGGDQRPRRLLEAARAWLRSPCDETMNAVVQTNGATMRSFFEWTEPGPGGVPVGHDAEHQAAMNALAEIGKLGDFIILPAIADRLQLEGHLRRTIKGLLMSAHVALGQRLDPLTGRVTISPEVGREAFALALRECLVPWALGLGDPLLDVPFPWERST